MHLCPFDPWETGDYHDNFQAVIFVSDSLIIPPVKKKHSSQIFILSSEASASALLEEMFP